jgi:hypothetical protein
MAELKQAAKASITSISRPILIAKAKPSAFTCRKNWNRRSPVSPPSSASCLTKSPPARCRRLSRKPLSVNIHLVEAQQARRVLDRLVGYKISPLLWDKVRRGLSAGRVQTVAVRLIVEREREIRAFIKQEYWTIDVALNAKKAPVLTARLFNRATTKPPGHQRTKPLPSLKISITLSLHRQIRRHQRKEAQPGRALHHFHAPAGILPQAALQRQAHHDAGARAV